MRIASGMSPADNPFMKKTPGAQQHAPGALAAKRAVQLSAKRTESYNEIYTHELAHHSAAGKFSGGINIVYDGNGIAVSGFVPLFIPGINQANPSQSIADFHQIKTAALAPAKPSGADTGVAASADALMFQAQAILNQKSSQAAKVGMSSEQFKEHENKIGNKLNMMG